MTSSNAFSTCRTRVSDPPMRTPDIHTRACSNNPRGVLKGWNIGNVGYDVTVDVDAAEEYLLVQELIVVV